MKTSDQTTGLHEALARVSRPPDPLDRRLTYVCETLIGLHRELAQVERAIHLHRISAYQHSHEDSIKGRDRDADINTSGLHADKITLKGEISSFQEERDLLLTLRTPSTQYPLFSMEASRASHPSTTTGQPPVPD